MGRQPEGSQGGGQCQACWPTGASPEIPVGPVEVDETWGGVPPHTWLRWVAGDGQGRHPEQRP